MRRIATALLGTLMLSGIAVTAAQAAHADDFEQASAQFTAGNVSVGYEYTQDKSGGFGSDDE